MRTTVDLPEDLLREARSAAAVSGRTLTSIVEEALRERLARRAMGRPVRRRLQTWGRGGTLPGVDLDDSAALLDVMDGTDAPPRR